MDVDRARDDVATGRVDHAVGSTGCAGLDHRADPLAIDDEVGASQTPGRHDGTPRDDQVVPSGRIGHWRLR
jgi:hypothetical protein